MAQADAGAAPATLVDLFARSASRHPDSVAVSDGDRRLSYAELAARSDRLAAGLAALGVRTEDRVLVDLPSTVDSVVALVGIAKAGAASLPVDRRGAGPDGEPAAGMRLVLGTGSPTADPAAARPGTPAVDLSTAMAAGPEPATPAAGTGGPAAGNAACVLPAPGPGGEPRHVVLEHRQLAPLLLDPVLLPPGPGDRVAPAAGLAAAEAQLEMWRALAGGAELIVLPAEQRGSAELPGALRRRQVSVLSAPADELDRLVRPAGSAGSGPAGTLAEALGALRVLHATGLGLHPDTVKALRAASFTGRLLSRYGPVETAATAAVHQWSGDEDTDGLPLGRPPAGVRHYVLEQELAPVPAGTPGELYVGGVAVGRGYLDRPELTVDRFLPDPFSAGGRMYPTGELVSRRADGLTRHLGPAEDP